jgi:hypothetical protein
MPGDPHSGGKVWKAPDREIGKPGENRGKVIAHRNLQPPAAFHDRENCRNLRSRLRASDVQPILSTKSHADDDSDAYARFIESALKSGNVVIVAVTEAHRASLLPRLEADGVDVAAAIKHGSYVPLDPADALVTLTVNDMPDPVRCRKVIGDLVIGAAKGVKGEHGQVVVCGEIEPTLLCKGNAEGAIKLEHLWDEITEGYGVHTLCGYLWSAFPDRESSQIFRRICGEHSAVHGRELGY